MLYLVLYTCRALYGMNVTPHRTFMRGIQLLRRLPAALGILGLLQVATYLLPSRVDARMRSSSVSLSTTPSSADRPPPPINLAPVPPQPPLPSQWLCRHQPVDSAMPACMGFPGLPTSCAPGDVLRRWHVTTQELLFIHLRQVWPDDRPRVMVDLGSHAGHGVGRNLSDALLWLEHFHAEGSLVLAVDAFEDYALDLQVGLAFRHIAISTPALPSLAPPDLSLA